MKTFDGPACVAAFIQCHHPQDLVDWDRPGRSPANPSILQPLNAHRFITGAPPAKYALRDAPHFHHLAHREFPPLSPGIQLLKSHRPDLLEHCRLSHGDPPSETTLDRTDHVLKSRQMMC